MPSRALTVGVDTNRDGGSGGIAGETDTDREKISPLGVLTQAALGGNS